MKRFSLWLTLLGFVFASVVVMASEKTLHKEQHLKSTSTIVLSIPSMTCSICPITVKKALEKVKGVNSVTINFKNKIATIHFNSKTTTVKALTTATKNAGYPSTVKRN